MSGADLFDHEQVVADLASDAHTAKFAGVESLGVEPLGARPAATPEEPLPLAPLSAGGMLAKRIEDIVFGSIALLLLGPLMLLIALVVKLDSPGPVLFCQPRSGRQREIICIYKFRTMYARRDNSFRQARRHDPRVTRFGAFLRRTSLDELPQLFNVIQGSMSLVGPRPHPLQLDEDFSYAVPTLSSRYHVKPGITGWAQINGFRGETRHVRDMVRRVEHDRHYIRHWSFWLDVKILCLTVVKGWTHDNAF